MGCCAALLRYVLYVSVPLSAILMFYELECKKEREEYLSNKFYPEYRPEMTDCSAELFFSLPRDTQYFNTG